MRKAGTTVNMLKPGHPPKLSVWRRKAVVNEAVRRPRVTKGRVVPHDREGKKHCMTQQKPEHLNLTCTEGWGKRLLEKTTHTWLEFTPKACEKHSNLKKRFYCLMRNKIY